MGSTAPTPVPTRKTAVITPHSAVRCARRLFNPERARLDLNQPFGIQESAHADQRSHRLDRSEHLTVCPPNLPPAARHGRENPGAGHVIETGTDAGERLADDPQTLPSLLVNAAFTDG